MFMCVTTVTVATDATTLGRSPCLAMPSHAVRIHKYPCAAHERRVACALMHVVNSARSQFCTPQAKAVPSCSTRGRTAWSKSRPRRPMVGVSAHQLLGSSDEAAATTSSAACCLSGLVATEGIATGERDSAGLLSSSSATKGSAE